MGRWRIAWRGWLQPTWAATRATRARRWRQLGSAEACRGDRRAGQPIALAYKQEQQAAAA